MEQLYAQYVSGNLPIHTHVMVQSHLQLKPETSAEIALLECLCAHNICTDEITENLPATLCVESIINSSTQFDAPSHSANDQNEPISVSCSVFPKPLHKFLGYDAQSLPWKPLLPGFWYYPIQKNNDGSGAYMFWIKRGKSMPAHKHAGTELTLVLQGGISDGEGNFRRGDIAIEYEHSEHRPTAHSDIDCICMAIYDEPIEFTHGVPRLLQKVFQ